MTIIKNGLTHDAGSVDGATGGRKSGCQNVTPSRVGPGDYLLTLDEPLDEAEGALLLSIKGLGLASAISHNWLSDTQIQVLTSAAGAPADISFSFQLLNLVGV